MRAAATSLATGPAAWATVHRTALLLFGATFIVQSSLFFSPLGALLLNKVAAVPDGLLANTTFASQLAAFAIVGSSLRFLYQGIQVRWRVTGGVLVGILVRVAAMAVIAWVCTVTGWPDSGATGTIILGSGMIIEGIVGFVEYRLAARRGAAQWVEPQSAVSAGAVLRFALPLAASGIVVTLGRPVLNGFLAHSGPAVVASYALAWTMANVLQGPIGNLHQVTLVFSKGDPDSSRRAMRFALGVGGLISGATLLISLTPFGSWFLGSVIGAEAHLIPAALASLAVQAPIAVISAHAEHLTGLLLLTRRTRLVSAARLVRFAVTVLTLWPVIYTSDPIHGTVLAAVSLVCGFAAEWALLAAAVRKRASVAIAEPR